MGSEGWISLKSAVTFKSPSRVALMPSRFYFNVETLSLFPDN